MIEVYLFLVMFFIQILVLSVLHPARLTRLARDFRQRYPAETHHWLYQDASPSLWHSWRAYRWLNHGIALLGFGLLAGFYDYMLRADWSDGPVETLLSIYFMLQLMPLLLCSWKMEQLHKRLREHADSSRKTAELLPRRLTDFVPAPLVALLLLLYPLYLGYVFMISKNPFPGFAGLAVNLVTVTLLYAWTFGVVWFKLNGRKTHPHQSRTERLHDIETTIRIAVFTCLAGTIFMMGNFVLVQLDRQALEPLAASLFFVVCALLYYRGIQQAGTATPEQPA